MKRSNSVVRRICWLIVMFAAAGFSPSEFGGEHKAVALEKKERGCTHNHSGSTWARSSG
jgi:hypothetical protein